MWKKTIGIMLALVLMISVWFPAIKRIRASIAADANVQAEMLALNRIKEAVKPLSHIEFFDKVSRAADLMITAPYISARKPVWPNTC